MNPDRHACVLRNLNCRPGRTYDIAPNERRFLMLKRGVTDNTADPFAGSPQIVVVQHWFSELQARVPTGR